MKGDYSMSNIKTIQSRYMTIEEDIYLSLDIHSMSLYTALRYEGDYSTETSKVIKSMQYLCERAKISRRKAFESLNVLEKFGLIKRENEKRLGEVGLIWVSKHMGFFKPVHDMHTPVHDMHTPVHQVHTYQESIQQYDHKEREIEEPTKNLEYNLKIDHSYQYPETYYQNTTKNLTSINQSGTNITISDINTFEEFWRLYPRQGSNKEKVRAQWFHDGCNHRANEIISKLKEQIRRDKTFVEGFAPTAHKYIVEKRFENTIYEGKKSKGKFDHNDTSWADKSRQTIFD